MSTMRRWRATMRALACIAAAWGALLGGFGIGGGAAWAADEPTRLVRPVYEEGRLLGYTLALKGAVAWSPAVEGLSFVSSETDFAFALRGKAVRGDGSCTFELIGRSLRSTGEIDKGKIGIEADREGWRVRVENRWHVRGEQSPLTREMTVTFGALGEWRFGTGLLPIMPYMLPTVDRGFWSLVTTAPREPVKIGDAWEQRFDVPVPGAKGEPLVLTASWRVKGWQRHRGRQCLAIAIDAAMPVTEFETVLDNGDRLIAEGGTAEAHGVALWDLERGTLSYANVKQKLLIRAGGTQRRALRAEVTATLDLTDFKAAGG